MSDWIETALAIAIPLVAVGGSLLLALKETRKKAKS